MAANEELYHAWNNWFHFWEIELGEHWNGDDHQVGGWTSFERFIGQELLEIPLEISPEAAHRVRLLLSPHHHAILKAYKAKHFPQEVS